MKTRLIGIIALIEAVLVIFLFLMLKQDVLPDKIGVVLVWLLPIAFGVHVAEEFAFPKSFDDWYKAYRPKFADTMTSSSFIKTNVIAIIASTLLAIAAFTYTGAFSYLGLRGWFVFLGIVAFNAVFHIRGAMQTKQYCPGVVTSILLYLPLTVTSFIYFLRTGVIGTLGAVICILVGSSYQFVLDGRRELVLRKREQE